LRIFDWPFASAGPAEFDVVAFCQAVAAEGGPAAERVLGWYEEVLRLRPEMIDASLAGISGYFADRGWRPPIEGLPRVRRWQRDQLKECLRWAARRFELADAEAKLTRTTALSLVLDNGKDLRYRDDKRMGKVHVLDEAEGTSLVHGFDDLGPDAGDFSWNEREFAQRARATRREVRNLLQDQTFVAGIGNAYADEILWEAQLHPKRRVATLSDEEMSRFYRALKDVIARGVLQVEEHLPPELGTKIRDHMKVRGHKGKPCPRCGTPIIKPRHGLDDMYLCPRCQPPPKGLIR